MYTGLPLIPAMTPVSASGPPSSLARMRSRCGASTFFSVPMMRTVNSSTASPRKTVRPTPTIPGRTSETGITVLRAPTGPPSIRAARHDAPATRGERSRRDTVLPLYGVRQGESRRARRPR